MFEKKPSWLSPKVVKLWRIVRPLVVLAISAGLTYIVFATAYDYVLNRYINPVDVNDATPIEFVVNNNDSASSVATRLANAGGEERGLISNPTVFKVYVDFVGKADKLKVGTYILSRNMDITQIVDIICEGNPPKQTLMFTVQEGYTIKGILQSLERAEMVVDENAFLEMCNNADAFSKYDFISLVLEEEDVSKRDYLLEGYLFPDTYEIYVDALPETIINKMLVRFNEIFTDTYIARAQELGMTIDEIVTLASIIEREAKLEDDFKKVSAAFHNRLRAGQNLESCATMQYVLKVNKYIYTDEELATVSPYNTYKNPGLPIGPISNPGKMAIEAALYPNETYIEKDYRYFCNMDLPENEALIFAKTYEEHKKNIEKYSKYWS
ncbi:endolytic transglycosylase MltG [Eubacteriales bacterium OttesenSCG-928-K08]|nr:endolytic transglycosylase MltG [Eubacteriales bacterium OttesenSCG-928-K08]